MHGGRERFDRNLLCDDDHDREREGEPRSLGGKGKHGTPRATVVCRQHGDGDFCPFLLYVSISYVLFPFHFLLSLMEWSKSAEDDGEGATGGQSGRWSSHCGS